LDATASTERNAAASADPHRASAGPAHTARAPSYSGSSALPREATGHPQVIDLPVLLANLLGQAVEEQVGCDSDGDDIRGRSVLAVDPGAVSPRALPSRRRWQRGACADTKGRSVMGDDAAVRAATAEDRAAVSGAVAASGLLAGHDLDEVMATFEAGGLWLIHPDPVGAGVAYAAEEPLTDRTWNLLMLVVHPARQGQGVGRALVRAAERAVRQRGGRLLQVDTSRVAGFAG